MESYGDAVLGKLRIGGKLVTERGFDNLWFVEGGRKEISRVKDAAEGACTIFLSIAEKHSRDRTSSLERRKWGSEKLKASLLLLF